MDKTNLAQRLFDALGDEKPDRMVKFVDEFSTLSAIEFMTTIPQEGRRDWGMMVAFANGVCLRQAGKHASAEPLPGPSARWRIPSWNDPDVVVHRGRLRGWLAKLIPTAPPQKPNLKTAILETLDRAPGGQLESWAAVFEVVRGRGYLSPDEVRRKGNEMVQAGAIMLAGRRPSIRPTITVKGREFLAQLRG